MIDPTKTTPEKLAEMNDSLIVDNSYLRGQLLEIRAENEALHTKLAQFTKWNSQLTAKCNWYNCDGARLERENESLTEMNDSLIVDNNHLRQRVQELSRA